MTHQFKEGLSLAEKVIFFDDLLPGFQFETSSRTITEADVVAFAALTGDYNRIHVDVEFAQRSKFGQRIAHGLLVASISSGLFTRSAINAIMEPSLIAVLQVNSSFRAPVFIGDTIKVRATVLSARGSASGNRGVVVFERAALNQRGETVVVMEVTSLFSSRPEAPSL